MFDLGGNRPTPAASTTQAVHAWLEAAGQPQASMGHPGVGAFAMVGYRATWNDSPVAIKYAPPGEHRFRLTHEHRFAQWAAAHGLGPTVRAFNEAEGALAVDFMQGGTFDPLKAADPNTCEAICTPMAKLHAAPWPDPIWEENLVITATPAP